MSIVGSEEKWSSVEEFKIETDTISKYYIFSRFFYDNLYAGWPFVRSYTSDHTGLAKENPHIFTMSPEQV